MTTYALLSNFVEKKKYEKNTIFFQK